MGLFTRRRDLVAPDRPALSAIRLTQPKGSSGVPAKRLKTADWQKRSFAYYDELGCIWYAAQFYARALPKLELYVERIDDDPQDPVRVGAEQTEAGDPVPLTAEDEAALAALDRIQDPAGGRANLLATYGRLQFLTGESLLMVTFGQPATPGGEPSETWEMLSTDELKREGTGRSARWKRFSDADSTKGVELKEADPAGTPNPGEVIIYRFWRRHPRFSNQADAPMRGVLDDCEELLLLTQGVRAKARSRVAGAGILYIHDDVTAGQPPSVDENGDPLPDQDDNPDADPLMKDLTEAMTTPIADESAASAVVPMLMRGGMDADKAIKHIQVGEIATRSGIYPETGLRKEAIERIALGLDFPPELLLGVTDANHWSSWLVDEVAFKAHLAPVCDSLVIDLTGVYFRPTLAGDVADPSRYRIAYDPSGVVQHPDRGAAANDGVDRFALSTQAWREAHNFDDNDAMSEEEQDRLAQLRNGGAGAAASDGTTPGDVQPGPPADESAASARLERVLGAAELMVLRCREAATARMLTSLPREVKRDLAAEIADVEKHLVMPTIGRARATQLRNGSGAPDPAELVSGAGQCFRAQLRAWGADESATSLLARAVERHAAATLFRLDPGPLPDFVVDRARELVES